MASSAVGIWYRRWIGRAPDKPKKIFDAVFLEAEPSSEHAKSYGRMGAVHVLGDEHLDRWFLSDMRHGRDLGRPW